MKLSRIVYLASIALALLFVAVFFSSLDIEQADSGEVITYFTRSSIYFFYDSDALWTVSF